MIHYLVYLKNPQSHYIYIDCTIDNIKSPTLTLQLPAWRPGRYELGNFAKNIKKVDVFDEANNTLPYLKTTKDCWVIQTLDAKKIKVTYSYYTSEINAGNCFADETQIYLNPVHLCMYVSDRMNEPHCLELTVADDYKIASSMSVNNKTLMAQNYDELADSPIFACANIQSDYYIVNNTKFWLHFVGECKPDFDKLKKDFIKFTQTQWNFWVDFPVSEYHFMFQILPFKFYHGVEHCKSTVIAIGPGYAINNGSTYESLLGVSSHELFHTWNIKYIRPAEMLNYDYTKENYARTGFVYEGFTTYYGDVMLLTSGVFSNQQYFETLEERLLKHFHNYGRFNLSVADSSFDTWLDGYAIGAPYRKTSIYDEGNLVAFMLDVLIMKLTKNKKSLRDVCRILYNNFGNKQIGYTEHDIISICESVVGKSLTEFFNNYVFGNVDFESPLKECFDYLEIEVEKKNSEFISESLYGFKTIDFGLNRKISLIAPYSPSWKAGLSVGDEIIAINNTTFKNDFNEWMKYYKTDEIILTVSSNQQLKNIILIKNTKPITYFQVWKLIQKEKPSLHFNLWLVANSKL